MLALLASLPFSLAAFAGNGAPSGAHYNLNIIGVPKTKSVSMEGNQGSRIFVKLEGGSKIALVEGPDFLVLDANGTDGNAKFQLPKPDPDGDGVSAYSVYARALGKPGGSAKMTTCAMDPVTMEEVCSINSLLAYRNKGQTSFKDVSKELLTISADIDGDGDIDTVSLFDDRLQDYLWSYDNRGLKILQLRFYPISTQLIP
jgi:hypothetical protein